MDAIFCSALAVISKIDYIALGSLIDGQKYPNVYAWPNYFSFEAIWIEDN